MTLTRVLLVEVQLGNVFLKNRTPSCPALGQNKLNIGKDEDRSAGDLSSGLRLSHYYPSWLLLSLIDAIQLFRLEMTKLVASF